MDLHLNEEIECPHLHLVGDSHCRLCLHPVRGTVLTDQNLPPDDGDDDGIDWGSMVPPPSAPSAPATWTPEEKPTVTYPEHGPLQEAPISINFKVTGEPQITVRGFNGAEITGLLQDLADHGVWANIAAAQADLRAQGQLGGGLGPMTPVPPAQPAPGAPQFQSPGAPPFGPNVSAPSAPGYVGQPSFPSGPTPSWGGAPGGGQGGGNRAEPKPQPPGWFRVNARSGPGFDAWKQWREQYKDQLKGKVSWGGKSDYWVEPSIAGSISQMGYAVTP